MESAAYLVAAPARDQDAEVLARKRHRPLHRDRLILLADPLVDALGVVLSEELSPVFVRVAMHQRDERGRPAWSSASICDSPYISISDGRKF